MNSIIALREFRLLPGKEDFRESGLNKNQHIDFHVKKVWIRLADEETG
jgi:hypothetical protein